MSKHAVPKELSYTNTHEWIRDNGDGTVTLGITDHAQAALGDMVFVELPAVVDVIGQGDEIGVVESVKAASDIYSPMSGKVVEVNEELSDSPSLINSDPYGDGWIVKIQVSDADELDDLMDAADYKEHVASEA
jgi:glycine cleavage system H protein